MGPRKVSVIAQLAVVLSFFSAASMAQWQRGRGWDRGQPDRNEIPVWDIPDDFRHDVFTFVRVEYDSWSGRGFRGGRGIPAGRA